MRINVKHLHEYTQKGSSNSAFPACLSLSLSLSLSVCLSVCLCTPSFPKCIFWEIKKEKNKITPPLIQRLERANKISADIKRPSFFIYHFALSLSLVLLCSPIPLPSCWKSKQKTQTKQIHSSPIISDEEKKKQIGEEENPLHKEGLKQKEKSKKKKEKKKCKPTQRIIKVYQLIGFRVFCSKVLMLISLEQKRPAFRKFIPRVLKKKKGYGQIIQIWCVFSQAIMLY